MERVLNLFYKTFSKIHIAVYSFVIHFVDTIFNGINKILWVTYRELSKAFKL